MQRALILPRDNKFTDSEGRILPQWRSVLERLEPLSRLTGTEIERLVSLLKALTEGDDPFVTADGEINLLAPDLNVSLSIAEKGTPEITQSSSDGLSLDFRNGLDVSEPNRVTIPWAPRLDQSVQGVPYNVISISGSMFAGGGDAYALPLWVEDTYTYRFQGPMTTALGSGGSRSCGVYKDANGTLGEAVEVYTATGYAVGVGVHAFDWGSNRTLPRGKYWLAFAVTGAPMTWLAISAALNINGARLISTAFTPSWGLFKTGTGGVLTASETGWAPSTTASFPLLYLST